MSEQKCHDPCQYRCHRSDHCMTSVNHHTRHITTATTYFRSAAQHCKHDHCQNTHQYRCECQHTLLFLQLIPFSSFVIRSPFLFFQTCFFSFDLIIHHNLYLSKLMQKIFLIFSLWLNTRYVFIFSIYKSKKTC